MSKLQEQDLNNKKGFTLIELIVVIAVVAILVLIAMPSITGYIQKSQISADYSTLRTLNSVSYLYDVEKVTSNEDIFNNISEDKERIEALSDAGLLSVSTVNPQNKEASFS